MLFVTEEYLIFFTIVFLLYWNVPKYLRFSVLFFGSLYFYGTWSVPFIFHLILVIAINYYGIELWKVYKKKWIVVAILFIDVFNIAVFKYFYLFWDFLGSIGNHPEWKENVLRENLSIQGLEIFLPLGISFYTFQIMSYTYDIYSGRYQERHSFREVLLYVLFFPQLIAGPIMRSEELLPQIRNIHNLEIPEFKILQKGFWFILIGVFKKLIIADNLSNFVAPLHYHPIEELSTIQVWLYVFSSLMMLYADFSAYSDIARGCGYFLGFEIPINFKAPFFMRSISDFWRRWHLTFSMWIRDYIYIPLGGSRVPEYRNYLNLIITFFLGGLWHGASYNFIIWGLLMGFILSFEAFCFKRGFEEWPVNIFKKFLRILITWFLMLTTALFFFVKDFYRALSLLKKMLLPDFQLILPSNGETILYSFLFVILFNFIEEYPEKLNRLKKHEFALQMLVFFMILVALLEFSAEGKDFFYFQF
ncbi:MAG: MBOAT family O-acyltransferase [Leptonema sp. (in: bacteria)]